MTVLDEIKERMAYYFDLCGREPREVTQRIITDMDFCGVPRIVELETTLTNCKDCKHYEREGMYEGCCMLHFEHMEGYDPLSDSSYDNDIGMYEMPSDGFCSSAERRDE